MKTARLLLHSFLLAVINIGAILIGFSIYRLFKPPHQVAFQAPVAALLSAAIFLPWSLVLRNLTRGRLSLRSISEMGGTWLLALLWSPVIFIPLHYLGRGYLTSWANIWNLWLFQMPANLVAVWLVWKLIRIDEV
jgi:hypothetical protein